MTRASKDDRNGLAKNSQVQKHIPIFNVLQIKHDILFERGIMAGRYLPEAGKTGRDV